MAVFMSNGTTLRSVPFFRRVVVRPMELIVGVYSFAGGCVYLYYPKTQIVWYILPTFAIEINQM